MPGNKRACGMKDDNRSDILGGGGGGGGDGEGNFLYMT